MTWIILVITFGHDPQDRAMVPFRDAMRCGDALPAIHAALTAEHPDAMVQCIESGIPRVRPRARPETAE